MIYSLFQVSEAETEKEPTEHALPYYVCYLLYMLYCNGATGVNCLSIEYVKHVICLMC